MYRDKLTIDIIWQVKYNFVAYVTNTGSSREKKGDNDKGKLSEEEKVVTP